MTDVLTAIDDALDTGVAADDDPLTRELQELALALRADAPEPTPEFREWLDRRVESGLPEAAAARPLVAESRPGARGRGLVVLALACWCSSWSGRTRRSGAGGDSTSSRRSAAVAGEASGGGGGAGAGGQRGRARRAPRSPELEESGRRAAGAAAPRRAPLPPAQRGFVPGRSDRKIERSIGLELEMPVDEMARVAEQVTTVTNRHGGFVLSSSVSTGEDSAGGDFELRIPVDPAAPGAARPGRAGGRAHAEPERP